MNYNLGMHLSPPKIFSFQAVFLFTLEDDVTHSRGKIEYNCRYFLMIFRKRIRKKNSVKMISILYRVLCLTAHLPMPQV
jgi:hypothetical protein